MIKNLTSTQLLLIAMVTILLLLAAFSFYLLQDPSAPLPFAPQPVTVTPTFASAMPIIIAPTVTSVPTRQTSYTPFATILKTQRGTITELPNQSETALASGTVSPQATSNTATITPNTVRPTSGTATPTPSATTTLSAGEKVVTGRILKDGIPLANVKVEFEDDIAPRDAITNQGGHYRFTTLAPGSAFTLTFRQSENPSITPVSEIASLAWIEGNLPTGVDIIDLPDFEISTHLGGMIFELQTPVDGAAYLASVISISNPIQFTWSLYNQGESYYVQLGRSGEVDPIFTSSKTTQTYLMWNGILNDASHISAGTYWWRVAATKSLGSVSLVVFTQQYDLIFN